MYKQIEKITLYFYFKKVSRFYSLICVVDWVFVAIFKLYLPPFNGEFCINIYGNVQILKEKIFGFYFTTQFMAKNIRFKSLSQV